MTMTIEIKQLIIRAVVDGRRERPAGPSGVSRETMIAECARQVLRELHRGRGR